MILDRTIPPAIKPFQEIIIPELNEIELANMQKLYFINAGSQPVVRIELIFEAGSRYEKKIGASYFTSKMLLEGSKKYKSEEIAEKFASIGYFVEITQGSERLNITLNGLTKHLKTALILISELIAEPIFPINELENLKRITKQSLAINLEKTSYLASIAFKEHLFGNDNYIGKTMNEADIDAINQEDLQNFYQENLHSKPMKIFMAGKIESKEIDLIQEIFGWQTLEASPNLPIIHIENIYSGKKNLIEKVGSLQSSIRLGRRIIARNHPDYFAVKICNTILGGYFGSRLMKNIREEKGFTYGISSSFLAIPNFGYLMIGTDVKREFTQNTIEEIKKEINILQNDLVADEELETVKNFLIGDFAGSLNTPFEILEKHKLRISENLPADFYKNYVQNIKEVTSQHVLAMAQIYFAPSEMLEVVVGGLGS